MSAFVDFTEECRERGLLEGLRARCREHHARLEDVFGPSRATSTVNARHACFAWLVLDKGMSRAEVARLFKREHGGVINGLRRHRERAA